MENQRQCIIPIHKPNGKELAFFFASGFLVSIPFAYFFELLYPTDFSVAIYFIIFGPFIEEIAKAFPLFYRHGETERSLVTLGLLIGLGFGIAEFSEYVFLFGVPPIVRASGIIFHASSATITAYGIAKKKPLPYYFLAIMLHVAYNFIAFSGEIILYLFGAFLVLVTAYLLAWRFYQRASKEKIVGLPNSVGSS